MRRQPLLAEEARFGLQDSLQLLPLVAAQHDFGGFHHLHSLRQDSINRSSMAAVLMAAMAFASVATEEVFVTYANGATSERNLPVCRDPRTACNLVYLRYWLTPKVVRLCKCPDRSECPYKWRDDNRTLFLNSRSQIKFCSPVADLRDCSETEAALETHTSRKKRGSPITGQKVSVFCYCPRLHHYKLLTLNSTDNPNFVRNHYYKCKRMGTCQSNGFCGYITTQRYDTYQECVCPQNHLCITSSKKTSYITEALYEGYAHRAVCAPRESA